MRIAQRFNVRFQSATSRKSRRGGGKFNPTDQAVFSGGYSQGPEPRRGVMFVAKLGHLAVFVLFSAGGGAHQAGRCKKVASAAPLKTKGEVDWLSFAINIVPLRGFGQRGTAGVREHRAGAADMRRRKCDQATKKFRLVTLVATSSADAGQIDRTRNDAVARGH
jgi:hypothetical protein